MQLKELTLKELLALFDASTHDQISDYFQDPEIHYIVVFANHFQPDMGLLTVGPTQDCTSLEQAKRAIIDRKFAKFVIRCKNCPPEKKKAETVIGLVRPIDRGTHLEPVRVAAATASPIPVAAAPAPVPVAAPVSATRPPIAVAPAVSPDVAAKLAEREAAIEKRELALKAIEAELKQREDELVEREEFVMQSEESLIDKIQKQERRSAELEQQEDNIRKTREQLTRHEAELAAKVAEFKAGHPDA
jgi:hypothetical protein